MANYCRLRVKEKGERRKEKGERRKEKGERRKEKGERRKEKGENLRPNCSKTIFKKFKIELLNKNKKIFSSI